MCNDTDESHIQSEWIQKAQPKRILYNSAYTKLKNM